MSTILSAHALTFLSPCLQNYDRQVEHFAPEFRTIVAYMKYE